jgi:hypothetical protein
MKKADTEKPFRVPQQHLYVQKGGMDAAAGAGTVL